MNGRVATDTAGQPSRTQFRCPASKPSHILISFFLMHRIRIDDWTYVSLQRTMTLTLIRQDSAVSKPQHKPEVQHAIIWPAACLSVTTDNNVSNESSLPASPLPTPAPS